MKIESKLSSLITVPLMEIGMIVDNVSYVKEGNTKFLRITIDKEPSINIDDCVKATKVINSILDKEELISEAYILDVCSKERGGK